VGDYRLSRLPARDRRRWHGGKVAASAAFAMIVPLTDIARRDNVSVKTASGRQWFQMHVRRVWNRFCL
jgi:hypothetical protein